MSEIISEKLENELETIKKAEALEWTYSIDKMIKAYKSNKNRIWKLSLCQKSTLKQFELILADIDFQRLYQDFSKNEKLFFEMFRPEINQKKDDTLKCVEILSQKLSIQQTDVGSVLMLYIRQKPNQIIKEATEKTGLYVPLKEFIRQKTFINDSLENSSSMSQAQYATNARYTLLQTTSKFNNKYLTVIVYYMVQLSKNIVIIIDLWKIKVRVASTGRFFIADIEASVYENIKAINEQKQKNRRVMKRTKTGNLINEGMLTEEKTKRDSALTNEEIISVPINFKFQSNKGKAHIISNEYIINVAMRENQNIAKEMEETTERKKQVAVRMFCLIE